MIDTSFGYHRLPLSDRFGDMLEDLHTDLGLLFSQSKMPEEWDHWGQADWNSFVDSVLLSILLRRPRRGGHRNSRQWRRHFE